MVLATSGHAVRPKEGGGGGSALFPRSEKETNTRFAQRFIVQSSLLLLQLPPLLWLEDAPDGSINHPSQSSENENRNHWQRSKKTNKKKKPFASPHPSAAEAL
jgi:hypothetical protein